MYWYFKVIKGYYSPEDYNKCYFDAENQTQILVHI